MSLQYARLSPLDPNTSDQSFDINLTNNRVRYDVRRWSTVSLSAVAQVTGSWGTAVLTVYRSMDGYNPFALETAQTLGPGDAASATIDTSAVPYLIVQLTTREGAQEYINIAANGKASS